MLELHLLLAQPHKAHPSPDPTNPPVAAEGHVQLVPLVNALRGGPAAAAGTHAAAVPRGVAGAAQGLEALGDVRIQLLLLPLDTCGQAR